jgi:hypothetical protein
MSPLLCSFDVRPDLRGIEYISKVFEQREAASRHAIFVFNFKGRQRRAKTFRGFLFVLMQNISRCKSQIADFGQGQKAGKENLGSVFGLDFL